MPPRRSHKKSRAGCRRCKNRKIKCDEVHPKCGNCSKHGVSCDFENPDSHELALTPSTQTSRRASTAGQGSSRTPSVNQSPKHAPATPPISTFSAPGQGTHPEAPTDRLMELRLMHQYTNITSATLFINSPYTAYIWQSTVPEMAFSGKTYLVDAMMSVAALHLRSQHPEDKSLAHASHAYAASTLQEYLVHLNRGITADNAEALFLTASLIAFQAVASRIFTKDDVEVDGPSTRYELPLAWFHAFQGVKTVVTASWQWIRGSEVVKAVIESQPSFHLDMGSTTSESYFGYLLDGLQEELSAESPESFQSTGQAYLHAVGVLNFAHKSPYPAASLAFPATVSRRFVELLETKRPRALAILACFFALLKRMYGVWWLKDISRREVMGLMGMFEPGSKWWRQLEWPIRIALWDETPIPSSVWGTELDPEPRPGDGSIEDMMSHIELMAQMLGQAGASDIVHSTQSGAADNQLASGLPDAALNGALISRTAHIPDSPLDAASPD